MTDRYIDYKEVGEYGKHLVDNLPPLAGKSDIVDVTKLGALVANAVSAVETELQKTSTDRSDLRNERVGTTEATEAGRDSVSRFYFHLRSLPKTTDFDFNAFFPGGTMGDLASLKPADVAGKAGEVLRGFDNAKNKSVAAFSTWKTEIETTRQTLSDALSGKGTSSATSFVASAALVEARNNFLHVYNKVAKPIIRGLLAQLRRENELHLFFKDLTIHEGSHPKAPTEGNGAPPVTP